jgi:hypothetical protein
MMSMNRTAKVHRISSSRAGSLAAKQDFARVLTTLLPNFPVNTHSFGQVQ